MFKPIKVNPRPLHGGDLTSATKEFGPPIDGWIDLSTGINATCYPNTSVSAHAIRMLPTPGDIENLLHAARQFYKVSRDSQIIAAPGTQAILQNLPLSHPNHKVAILSPTYSEHQRTWEQSGNEVIIANNFDALSEGTIAVLVNPNNPDGRRYKVNDLLKLSRNVQLLIVDEAFCDDSPELSSVSALPGHNIIVLRSLGKFFGLAGLRLGFLIGETNITKIIEERLGPWAVSGPAIEIGTRALSDRTWFLAMRETLKSESRRLNELLANHRLKIIGGTDLFTLIETDAALNLYNFFGQAGIFVRRFENQLTWLRIGLPGTEVEWERLKNTLKRYR